MGCRTAKVSKTVEKKESALNAVDQLEADLNKRADDYKKDFFDKIDKNFELANVTDARQISYDWTIKTEYSSEFSLDKIAAVIVSALEALAKATDPLVPAPAMSADALDAYGDVVVKVAEAAKSSSQASASLSFSMTRLSPGIFAFLNASTVSIQDETMFGAESVTATSIQHRFMQSIDDVKNEAEFGAALIDAQNLLDMKRVQASLTDALAAGEMTLDDWMARDAKMDVAIQRLQQRLDERGFDKTAPLTLGVEHGMGAVLEHSLEAPDPSALETRRVLEKAIAKLSASSAAYKRVIEVSESRLKEGYF